MKLGLPKPPRLKPPHFGLPGLPKPAAARVAGRGSKLVYLAAGVSVLAALGAPAWLIARPMLQAAPPAAASAEAKADALSEDGPAVKSDAASNTAVNTAETERTGVAQAGARPEDDAATQAAAAPRFPTEAEVMVRRLQDLEERVAGGDADAYGEMTRLLHRIAARFQEFRGEVWSLKPNARALVLYLLSGGQSALGRRILSAHVLAPADERLVKGAVAYLEGADGAERDALLELDPRALDAALGAQVAFVQAILLAANDRRKALGRLDLARLLGPGGLVEEAALRREVGLLIEPSDFEKLAGLARQYWMRFRHSPYAENFLRQFAGAFARASVFIRPEQGAQLEEFVDSLTAERRRALYLVAAQTAAVAGNSAFGEWAAQKAVALAAPDSAERQRALLYRAAARVARASAAPSANLLGDVKRDELPAGDRPLYDATAMASARIFRAPEADFAAPPPGAGDLADGELARAEEGLRVADSALAQARRSMDKQSR